MQHPGVQDLKRFRLPAGFRGRPGWYVQLWWLVQSTLFGLSPQFMFGWRRTLLRTFGAQIGKRVLIRPTARFTYPWKVSIGDDSWIGDEVVCYSLGPIVVGSNTVISQRSYLCAASHEHDQPDFPMLSKAVVVGDEAWLGTDVFVAPGVTVGRGTVVGARSSVYRSLPPMMICFGHPAVAVRPRTSRTSPSGEVRLA